MSERQLSGDFQIAILKVKMDSIERSRVRSDLKVIPIEMRKPWKTQGCERENYKKTVEDTTLGNTTIEEAKRIDQASEAQKNGKVKEILR